ncbi:DUF5703 family protein [Brevibacterium luteolum]|uniref:Uncharacterized protein n=1 Tax=Brevibacterium luteolum TaxID=199591 RepID=A0A2N6PKQ4_9MICO|nr:MULTISPECIES: DUF5703 family protein [Brevibacterium]MCT1656147.1 DUF5703 family protein [Brevibacterium luteolum]MCT1873244.1 DUF5703 family protein [Brevibacterium luteolum]MCT1890363.1 DUF5703 family protein [Brevibacterium luteolum]MCT1893212.1 DUF5703 family protein [Brevibacterium luteolum]MCT1924045.1 DUF5703 family protein [Brevibacterium luteolum]
MKRRRTPVEYEFRTVSLHREMTRSEAARLLTEEAEYGRWELARTRIGMGGSKTVWLRRRIIRIKHSA